MSDDIIDFYKKATEPLEEQVISEPIIEDNIPTPEEPFDKFLVQLAEKLKTDKKPEAIEKALEQTALETTNEGDDTFAKFLNNFAVIVKDDKNVRKDEIVKEATIDFIDKLKNEKIEVIEPVIEVTKPVIKRSHKIPDKFKDKIPVVEDVSTDRFFNREETKKENKYVNELKTADKSKKIPEKISKNTDLKSLIEKQVRESVSKIKQELGHELMTAGGGGTVAVQYANGGIMNGDLNVTGRYLSGGTDLATIFTGGGGSANMLLAGSQELILNTDGSISFPNNVIRPPDETVLHLTSETKNLTSYTEIALSPYGFFAYDGNSNSITFDSVDNAITLTTLNSSEWIFDKHGYLTGPNNVLTINGDVNILGSILSGGHDLFTLFNIVTSSSVTAIQTLNYNPNTYLLSISNGNSVSLYSIVTAASSAPVNVTFLSSVSSNWNSAYNIATVYANNSASYIASNTLNNTLTAYYTNSSFNNISSTFVINPVLTNTLTAYTANTTTNTLTSQLVTTPVLTNTLSAYTSNTTVNILTSQLIANPVLTNTLSGYLGSNTFNNTLTSYTTNTVLNSLTSQLITTSVLTNTLSAYGTNNISTSAFVTNSVFSNTLTAYTTNTTVNTLTSQLVSTPVLTNTLSAIITSPVLTNSLTAYTANTVTSSLTSQLVTSPVLTNTLSAIVTNSVLTNTLTAYTSNTTNNTLTAQLITSPVLTNTLTGYVSNNTFSSTLTAYTVNTTTNTLTSQLVTTPVLTNTLTGYPANSVLNNSLSGSVYWQNTYTTVTANSGSWNSAYTFANTNSAAATFTTSLSAPLISAVYFYGDGSNLKNLPTVGGGGTTAGALLSTLNGNFTALNANVTFNTLSATNLSAVYFYGDGSNLKNLPSSGNATGAYVPLSGGTMTGGLSTVSVSANQFYGSGSESVLSDGLGNNNTGNGANTLSLNFTNGVFVGGSGTLSVSSNFTSPSASITILNATTINNNIGIPVSQYLTTGSSPITGLLSFFNTSDTLAANGIYEILYNVYYSKNISNGSIVYIISGSNIFTSAAADYIQTISGGLQTNGAPTMAGVVTASTAAVTLPVTPSLTFNSNHNGIIRVSLLNSNNINTVYLALSTNSGTSSPLAGSYRKITRIA
jgi:hypothetical protein